MDWETDQIMRKQYPNYPDVSKYPDSFTIIQTISKLQDDFYTGMAMAMVITCYSFKIISVPTNIVLHCH